MPIFGYRQKTNNDIMKWNEMHILDIDKKQNYSLLLLLAKNKS